ncbi:glycoside hydrolase family 64 protein [Zasmidium cellare ATCC 36951]|uniref:Glycoside hydrolase family 64 protein n=1 Tax=Zasmidium cellare ATCC 36951 TaxID=1080233 RepID=A0A6A6CZB8_ZASCE|nr:glycoside hydrolase family 64 protein [Zasmidium cellare ATCC 36951]KAF2171232.1 glycoside hydrolase family 64 protein [Zasmidium cellare ATCC 36951]
MPSLADRIKSLVKRQSSKQNDQPKAEPFTPEKQAQPQKNQIQRPLKTYNRAAMQPTSSAATVTGTLSIALVNQTSSSQVYAYITGLALDNNNAVFLLQSDAKTPYYPASPSATGQALGANCSIPLGGPGNTVNATIPRLAGARIWFSVDKELTFLLNPGPGLVEPSVFNQSDPNYNTNFSFCEFTFNSAQVFVNISYVDFVSNLPVALTLNDTAGSVQHVGGMRADGLATVAKGLRAQTAKDGRRWSSLIVQSGGKDLRALSPNSGITNNPDWFATYWTDYVNQVWTRYQTQTLTVDTQAQWDEVTGKVDSSGILDFGDGSRFAKPTSKDIFGNSTGPFATGSNAKTNAIIPRLAAAFNRSTLLLSSTTPNGTNPGQYYKADITNHYSRIVHAANVDGLGYAFPYDDVSPDGGQPQEGAIFSFSPTKLTVTVGGNNASA